MLKLKLTTNHIEANFSKESEKQFEVGKQGKEEVF